jgi:hypothetical protein
MPVARCCPGKIELVFIPIRLRSGQAVQVRGSFKSKKCQKLSKTVKIFQICTKMRKKRVNPCQKTTKKEFFYAVSRFYLKKQTQFIGGQKNVNS